MYKFLQELPNDLTLGILENEESWRKSQIWMQTGAQFPFQKNKFGKSLKKWRKSAIKFSIKALHCIIS